MDSRRARERRICGAHVRKDVSGRGNPVWVHVLKHGKVVDEMAEHVVKKRVRRDIVIQHSTVRGCIVRRALLVMKHADGPSTQELHIVYDSVCNLLFFATS